jgi:iron-chelate-transporting ATPase
MSQHHAKRPHARAVPGVPVSDSTSPAMRGEQLVLSYGKDTVIHDVSVTLEPGRVTALVGPNGSGKSTLLRSLAKLHPISDGRVTLGASDDRDGTGDAAGEREISLLSARDFAREVTLFAQSRPAPQGLTVREVVAFGRHPYRRRFAGLSVEDRTVIDRAMHSTGVTGMGERPVGELSGGEIQRVWLAACIAQGTGVVLLDEPTNHLDLRYQIETLDLVRDLADEHGVAVGIVLHDLDHAAYVADSLLLLNAGRIHAVGTPLEVLTSANISEVYEIPVDVTVEPHTNRLRIDPVGRHSGRAAATNLSPSQHPLRKALL